MSSPIVKPVVEAAEKEVVPAVEKATSRFFKATYITSYSANLQRMGEVGKATDKFLRDVYEPEVKQTAESLVSKGTNRLDALRQATKEVQERRLGKNLEAMQTAAHAILAEKGPVARNAFVTQSMIYFKDQGTHTPFKTNSKLTKSTWGEMAGVKEPSAYKGIQDWERTVNKAAQLGFLSRVALPHLGQLSNNLLIGYSRSVFKGIADLMTNSAEAKELVMRSGALFSDLEHEAKKGTESKLMKLIPQMPFFSFERKQYVMISALAGKNNAETAAAHYLADTSDKKAMLTLARLGINPENVLENNGLKDQDILTAMYRQADEAMFTRSGRNTPPGWEETPITRQMSKYHHYIFTESKFVKDHIKEGFNISWAEGAKRVAILASVFPAVGWFTKAAMNAVTGNPISNPADNIGHEAMRRAGVTHKVADPASEYIESLAHYGGLGVAYSMIRSAEHRGLAGFALGPVYSTIADFGQDVINFGLHSGKWKPIARDVTRFIPVVGPYATKKFLGADKPGKKKTGPTVLSPHERAIQRKQRGQ